MNGPILMAVLVLFAVAVVVERFWFYSKAVLPPSTLEGNIIHLTMEVLCGVGVIAYLATKIASGVLSTSWLWLVLETIVLLIMWPVFDLVMVAFVLEKPAEREVPGSVLNKTCKR